MKLRQNSVFSSLFYTNSNSCVFQGGEHFNQTKSVISGHYPNFSSFMLILVLIDKVVRLLGRQSGLIMSLLARTTNKTSLSILTSCEKTKLKSIR